MNKSVVSLLHGATALCLLALFVCGCVTPRVDWNERVGTYTFDQAVLELGPPDKDATLQDGTRVAEWLTHHGYSYSYPVYYLAPYPYYAAPAPPTYVSTPDFFLRLTFGPDGNLDSWKRISR